MKKNLLAAMLLLSLSAHAKTFGSSDIHHVFASLYDHNLSIKTAGIDVTKLEQEKRAGFAGYLPSVDVNYSARDVARKKEKELEYEDNNVELRITQPLFDRKTIKANELAGGELRIARLQKEIAQTDAIFTLSGHLVEMLKTGFSIGVLEKRLTFLSEQQNKVEALASVGKELDIESDRIASDHRIAQAELSQAELEHKNTKKQVALLTGVDLALSGVDADFIPVLPHPYELEHWLQVHAQNNTDIRLFDYQKQVALMQLSQSRSDYYPKVEIYGAYKDFSTNVAENWQTTQEYVMGLQFTMNLYKGGSVSAGVESSRQDLLKEELNYTNAKLESENELTSLFYKLETDANLIAAYSAAVNTKKQLFEQVEIAYEHGVTTNLDVLESQQEKLDTAQNYNDALLDFVLDLLSFYKQAGVLDRNRAVATFTDLLQPTGEQH